MTDLVSTTQFDIPYRLDTAEAVEQARNANFLDLGKDYSLMLSAARNVPLEMPQALLKARRVVVKDFFMLKEQKEEVERVDYLKIANIDLVHDFEHVRNAIPWVNELSIQDSLIHALRGFPEPVRLLFNVSDVTGSLREILKSIVSTFLVSKKEISSYINSKNPNKLTPDDLKKLITARVLFEPGNQDILAALRADKMSGALAQQACAELLFVRIPAMLEPLCHVNAVTIRRKLFDKIVKLGASPRQKMAIFSYFKNDVAARDLPKTLDKICAIGAKILDAPMSKMLNDYVSSIKQKMEFESKVYEHLFLTPDLVQMRKLHKPGKVMKARYTIYENIIKTHTHVDTLSFYPTKCYLDISKYRISGDCTGSGLAERHLSTPNYFCIRIFKEASWRGNMYMLDFTKEHGVLLVDRIQLPRYLKADYVQFFDHLREVLEEMFADVYYQSILLPVRLSNHHCIQKIYDKYKKKLRRTVFAPHFGAAEHFESMTQKAHFVVLSEKK